MNRGKKLELLSDCCDILEAAERVGDFPVAEVTAQAAALARELFPPMAKPLTWSDGYKSILGYFCGAKTHVIHIALGRHFARDIEGLLIKECATAEGAKAACEAHHQARFLELLA